MTTLAYDRHIAIAIALAEVRREILLLVIALQQRGCDGARLAAERLGHAMETVRQLAASLPPAHGVERALQAIRTVMGRAESVLIEAYELAPILDLLTAAQTGTQPELFAQAAALSELDLDDLDLSRLWGQGCTLSRVSARRALVEVAELSLARLEHCDLTQCSFDSTSFDDATIEGCDLTRANLMRTSWRRATLDRCKAAQVGLTDARLDQAVFADCDLRSADFSVKKSTAFSTTRGTRFVRCDLRDTNWHRRHLDGVAFYDCKMSGAYGAPSLVSITIERPDLSVLGDGSQIGGPAEVIAEWSNSQLGAR